jgi:hypothetical protein
MQRIDNLSQLLVIRRRARWNLRAGRLLFGLHNQSVIYQRFHLDPIQKESSGSSEISEPRYFKMTRSKGRGRVVSLI